MTNDAKSSEVSGENAFNILQNLSSTGIPVDKVIENMEPKDAIKFLISQLNFMNERYTSIEDQLKQLRDLVKDDEKDINQRIERILSLMTSNMTFIKQMIQIEDTDNEKLTEQEKINARQELQFAGLVDRQNRFSMSLVSIDNNTKAILAELGKLKAKSIQHDQFHIKLAVIGTVVLSIGAWLLTGDNLTKLIVALKQLSP